MSKVIIGAAMSLDGFINDATGSVSRLYPDMEAMRRSELLQEAIRNTGAVLMGRRAYDMANGDLTGYEFQVPIFVLTHQAPAQVAKGGLHITFVNDEIGNAIAQAKAAAGRRDVTVVGGAQTIQQIINARLFDELQLDIVPVIFGAGLRFFEHLSGQQIELERIKVVESPDSTHLRFRLG
jgi:dihydrofolate reductase